MNKNRPGNKFHSVCALFLMRQRERELSHLCVMMIEGKKITSRYFFSFKFKFYLSHWIERAKKCTHTRDFEWAKLRKKGEREKNEGILIPFFRFGFLFILMMCVVGFSLSFFSELSASCSCVHFGLIIALHLIAYRDFSVDFCAVFFSPFGGW